MTPNSEDILLVDDSPANLRLLSQILSERGYRVRAVTSGPRALASIGLTLPDMILLDIRMPEMDGYEVCRQLRANPKTADIPILFISALDDVHDKVTAFAAGGLDYITKPFQLEEVLARVESHLSLRRLQRNLQEANLRMEAELALAAQVQASFIRRDLPQLPGWELAATLIPAKLTSGDFYDAVVLPGGALGIVIADVVDKGVGAALYMAMSCALLRATLAEHPERPDYVCEMVNARLLEYATADQFVTVFMGILDPHTGTLTYANAGHNPPLLLRASGVGSTRWLTNSGPPLGAFESITWSADSVQMASGDAVIMYTDGITEAESATIGFYGQERLTAAVGAALGLPAPVIRDAILADVQRFTAGASQADDMALMVLVRDRSVAAF